MEYSYLEIIPEIIGLNKKILELSSRELEWPHKSRDPHSNMCGGFPKMLKAQPETVGVTDEKCSYLPKSMRGSLSNRLCLPGKIGVVLTI